MKHSTALLLSCLLALSLQDATLANQQQPQRRNGLGFVRGALVQRQQTTPPGGGNQQTTPPGGGNQASNTDTTTTTTDPTTTTTTTSTPPTTTTTPTDTTTQQQTTQQQETTQQQQTTAQEQTTAAPLPSADSSTDLGTGTVTETITGSKTSDSAAASSSAPANSSDGDSGISTGSIIGLSVAGGVAVLGIIGFFIWKFTRKRFSDFDDNEAIKWPELNAHGDTNPDGHPLPLHNTGRAGFETASELSLSRETSNTAHAQNYSTTDLHTDPYAVPPLPHLNPNQPYHDDPNRPASYYDPYRGPVPNSFHDPAQPDWSQGGGGAEAIPMTQMGTNGNGRASPGPHAAYGGAVSPSVAGRASPGPQQMMMAGRMSPGPQQMMMAGRASPGPQVGLAGRASPGPRVAYDQYGAPL